ncbi:MAG: phosphoethanolamine transferase, partial [Hafnia sp.]
MNLTSNPFEPENKTRELLTPYTLLYFVLAALINLGLGYEFSVVYAIGLGCFFLLLG